MKIGLISLDTIGIIILLSLVFITVMVFIVVGIINHNTKKYKEFINHHSVALKQLFYINEKYQFKDILSYQLKHVYDSFDNFINVDCLDYLTAELVRLEKPIKQALKDTLDNKNQYRNYLNEVKGTCLNNQYDVDIPFKNKGRLFKLESQILKSNFLTPTTEFVMSVNLKLLSGYGSNMKEKHEIYKAEQIKEIINKINQKTGSVYDNKDVWDSLCKVERAKVTKEIRKQIYYRDHYTCKCCGKYNVRLEIDHIIPISRGGKTEIGNLQTLCHDCNKKKGTKTIRY